MSRRAVPSYFWSGEGKPSKLHLRISEDDRNRAVCASEVDAATFNYSFRVSSTIITRQYGCEGTPPSPPCTRQQSSLIFGASPPRAAAQSSRQVRRSFLHTRAFAFQ